MSIVSRNGVLTVCAANVCRSPLAQFLLESRLPSVAPLADVRWSSAGRHAVPGHLLCAAVRRSQAPRPEWDRFVTQHASRSLTVDDIDAAGLILTASQAERSAVSLLRPSARARTFTLLEAAALAEHAARTSPGLLAGKDGGLLAPLAAALHSGRGLATIPPHPRSGLFRQVLPGSPLDVPDAHETSVPHAKVIALIDSSVERLTRAIDILVRGAVPVGVVNRGRG